jgi:hypothetical protein
VWHWTSIHERIKVEVSSYYLAGSGVLIDPTTPEAGLAWFEERGAPSHVFLTNRHHYRHAGKYVEAFGCKVWCHEAGLHEFSDDEAVEPFSPGHTLPGDVLAIEVGAICPDETALRIPVAEGVIAFADGLVRQGDGPLGFVPDALMGDDPETVKAGLKAAFRRIVAEHAFDHLLLAHGHPWIGGGKEALRTFAGA